jgi:hypothetical protein
MYISTMRMLWPEPDLTHKMIPPPPPPGTSLTQHGYPTDQHELGIVCPEVEFVNVYFHWGFWAKSREFSDLRFLP